MLFYGETRYVINGAPVVGQLRTNCVQIEYLVVTFDDKNQKVRLSLCQAEVLKALAKDEELSKNCGCVLDLQPK